MGKQIPKGRVTYFLKTRKPFCRCVRLNTPTADRRPGGVSGGQRPEPTQLKPPLWFLHIVVAAGASPIVKCVLHASHGLAWPEAGGASAFSALPAIFSRTARLGPWAALFSKPKGCAFGSQTRSMWLPGLVLWTKRNMEWLLSTFLHQRDKLSCSLFVLMPLLHSSHLFLTFWSPGNFFYNDYVF